VSTAASLIAFDDFLDIPTLEAKNWNSLKAKSSGRHHLYPNIRISRFAFSAFSRKE